MTGLYRSRNKTLVGFGSTFATANMQVKTYKLHLDAYNQLPILQGESLGERKDFPCFADDGARWPPRYRNWKV
jgi:hypothetical protein